MALAKMQALANFLRDQNLFAAEQFDYWMENGENNYTSKRQGNGLLICRFRYDAVFSIERYSDDADLFLVLLSIWLIENDDNRDDLELDSPKVDVTVLDDTCVDLEITVTFDEPIEIVPDDEGPILFRGKRYSVAPALITDANKVGVGDSQARQTDKPYEFGSD